jgi:hypothetical protein
MRNKTRKLSKVKKHLMPRLCGVREFEIKYNLKIFLNSKIHINIECRDDLMYHIILTKVGEFKDMNNWSGYLIRGRMCKNFPEMDEFIKYHLNQDKDYIIESRTEKLKRLINEK